MVAGRLVAVLASLPIGWLCFRLRGPYFTIATIATAQVLMLVFLKLRDFAWGAEGTTIPNLGNVPLMMQFEAKSAYYYVALGLLALGLAITRLVERSFLSYYLVAIGEDENAAEAVSIDAPRIKRDIYMISAFLTAPAGTFYTQYNYFVDQATAFSWRSYFARHDTIAPAARQSSKKPAAMPMSSMNHPLPSARRLPEPFEWGSEARPIHQTGATPSGPSPSRPRVRRTGEEVWCTAPGFLPVSNRA